MFSKGMQDLIDMVLEDGVLTDQGKAVLIRRAEKEGIDIDELDLYIQSQMRKRQKEALNEEIKMDQQSKMGSIKKCPNCGSPIQNGWAVCPSCGFAFNVEENSQAYMAFVEKVQAIRINGFDYTSFDRKAAFIETYPIPNNRMALLEFLTQLKSLSNINGYKASFHAQELNKIDLFELSYWKLFEKCITIAKRSFSNDPDFQDFFIYYNEQIAIKEPEKDARMDSMKKQREDFKEAFGINKAVQLFNSVGTVAADAAEKTGLTEKAKDTFSKWFKK